MLRSHLARIAALSLVLAVLYLALARFGLTLATVAHSITLVWPPTGLALATLLLFGRALWPGVFAGALLVNALTPGVPVVSALGMAVGNTLEAVVGTELLRRVGFLSDLRRPRDGVALIGLGAVASTLVSATLGPLSLWWGGVIPRAALGSAAQSWWLGDLMGALIVAPLLLVWMTRRRGRDPGRWPEAVALLVCLVSLSVLVFTHPLVFLLAAQPYAVFPPLIWAALRFGPRGSTAANFVVSAISIWATARGQGPFAHASLSESLLMLQTFMAVVSVTSLMMTATAAERADALRVREEFIAVASHELRTPLTSLRLQVQRLRRLMARAAGVAPPPSTDGPQAALDVAERQVIRLADTANMLLDVTRLRTRDLTLDHERFDLVSLLRETCAALAAVAAQAESALEVVADSPIVGTWDRLRLQQVVSNLIENALKYAGGKPIFITATATDRDASLEIRDQGPGIPEGDRERIFRRFERRTEDRALPGVGLGLHIAREIVEAHAGEIRVSSRPGAGAAFTVTLPRQPSSGQRIRP